MSLVIVDIRKFNRPPTSPIGRGRLDHFFAKDGMQMMLDHYTLL